MQMSAIKRLLPVFFLLVLASPASALEWVKDFDAGLDEAYERGAPAFIFLAQAT
jgi:hypothetical protein